MPILLGVAIVVALLVRTFVIQTYYIPSGSMENTLQLNDRVLANKLVYHFSEPSRGDVVVFEAPVSWRSNLDDKDFIKRIIAVGGDHIQCCDDQGRILVNGLPLEEDSYLFTDASGATVAPSADDFDLIVPEGRVWVMGDHRNHSGDSRERYVRSGGDPYESTIDIDDVVGKSFLLYWPLGNFGWMGTPETYDQVPDPA
ncbi:signal peptidase I [Natronoglycomyces albus]|uniref:signal peptidase I n=1 Tax=Natronoglycomyces albus TaxID=2811108 RepID=UPI003CCCC7C2